MTIYMKLGLSITSTLTSYKEFSFYMRNQLNSFCTYFMRDKIDDPLGIHETSLTNK